MKAHGHEDPYGQPYELNASTELEFVAMMRVMVERSGRTRGQIAAFGNLPRSTVYHFVAAKTRTMPKNPEQVQDFAVACGLNPIGVRRVMWLWEKIRDEQFREAQSRSFSVNVAQSRSFPVNVADDVVDGELIEDAEALELSPRLREHLRRAIQEGYPVEVGKDEAERDFTAGDQDAEATAGAMRDVVVHGDFTVNNRVDAAAEDGGDQEGDDPPAQPLLVSALRDGEMFGRLMILLLFASAFVLVLFIVVVSMITSNLMAAVGAVVGLVSLVAALLFWGFNYINTSPRVPPCNHASGKPPPWH
uniref:Uncharacterized protein n=1 Tax=Streptomyces sp. 44030 TaxID=364102 RepID=Q2LEV5_9ACTN|nr:hypothetical protein [Streptomyces sp. 44030]ABC67360.1 hypothetical protein pRL1.31 [Streptomyces sp. 44030]